MKRNIVHITAAQRQVLGERLARRMRALRIEHDAGELCEIQAALERMEADTYGLCTDCGSAMSWSHLDAIPEAPRCEPCEHALETYLPASARPPTPRARSRG